MKRQSIMLPALENGEPDYRFMEEYTRELMKRKQELYVQYVNKQLEKLAEITKTGGGKTTS